MSKQILITHYNDKLGIMISERKAANQMAYCQPVKKNANKEKCHLSFLAFSSREGDGKVIKIKINECYIQVVVLQN